MGRPNGDDMSKSSITYDEAYQQMMDAARFLGAQPVDLSDSLGRVLAQDVRCDVDMPPFRKSAMDGFACRREDLEQELAVIETIPAGRMPTRAIGPGQCSRIMTGAPVPQGADCVVMVEHTSEVAPDRIRTIPPAFSMSDNMCQQGEDVRVGDVVLHQGQIITAAHIAVLAAVGCVKPVVARLPRVSVLATGSELVEPTERPDGARIRNSNSYQLCAQLKAMGITARYFGIISDDRSALTAAVEKARASSDVILLSGGVSEGDYDYGPDVLRASGFAFHFQSVAMQPGRPTLFGDNGSAWCWGTAGQSRLNVCGLRDPGQTVPLRRYGPHVAKAIGAGPACHRISSPQGRSAGGHSGPFWRARRGNAHRLSWLGPYLRDDRM